MIIGFVESLAYTTPEHEKINILEIAQIQNTSASKQMISEQILSVITMDHKDLDILEETHHKELHLFEEGR